MSDRPTAKFGSYFASESPLKLQRASTLGPFSDGPDLSRQLVRH